MHLKLRHRWFETCNRENISAKMEMWEAINSLYNDETRAYHNLDHIEDCLKKLDAWEGEVEDRTSVEIALWFHDIIYDTKRTDNEAASAGLAKHYLDDHPLAEKVFEFILATRHHALHMTDAESILCDIDLSTLGASETVYTKYKQAIRSEFSWVPEDMFCNSRINVLNSFINREFIFYTDSYRNKYEQQARKNIHQEIEELECTEGKTL